MPARQGADGVDGRRVRVLIADDDEDQLWLLREWVQAAGPYDVVAVAEDGHQAVAAAAQERPEVAVLDLSMPRMNGLQAAAELRRLLPSCRIVIQSSFTAERMGQHAIDAGADVYLEKSFAPGPLLAALEGLAPAPVPTPMAAPRAADLHDEAAELRRLRTVLQEAERRIELLLGLLLDSAAGPMVLLRVGGRREDGEVTGFDVVRATRAGRDLMTSGGCAVPVTGHVGPADPLFSRLVAALHLGEVDVPPGTHLLRTSTDEVLVRCGPDRST